MAAIIERRFTFCLGILSGLLLFSLSYAQTSDPEKAEEVFHKAEAAYHSFLQTYQELDYRKSLTLFKEAIEAFQAQKVLSPDLAESYSKSGILYHIYAQYDQALEAYLKAITIKKQLSNQVDTTFFLELILAGNIHYYQDQYDSALYYYNEAEDITVRYPNLYERKRLFNSLGAYYADQGNHHQAVVHYQKALSSLEKKDADYQRDNYLIQNNVAVSQLKLGKFEEAILTFQQIRDKAPVHNSLFYENLGNAYYAVTNYDSAIFFLNKALVEANPFDSVSIMNQLAKVHHKLNQKNEARRYFQTSLAINSARFNQKNTSLSNSYLGLGGLQTGEYSDSALMYYQKALISNTLGFENTRLDSNPQELTSVLSPLLYFTTLQKKADALLSMHQQKRDETYLNQALQCYSLTIEAAQYIQKTYDNDEAKLYLVQQVYPVYEKAIATAHKLYRLHADPKYVRKAFNFSEKSKAAVLSEMLDELKIKAKAQVSDSLIREERRWKQQITRTRLKLTENQDSQEVALLRQTLIDSEVELARTVKALQKDEKYYQLKYQQDSLNLSLLQHEVLSYEDALLEYFVGQDSLYTFLLSREKFQMKAVALDDSFKSALDQVRGTLYDYHTGQSYDQTENAYLLYQRLIQPLVEDLSHKKRLIIIPDGPLSYIPFEMLNNNPASNHYLIYDYTFSYAYSASLLQEAVQNRRSKETGSILAMAPFAGDEEGNIRSNGFNLLFSSKEEVEKVGGSIYLEDKATKRLFLELAGSYGIVHLATHASISSDEPLNSFIAFYPEQDSSDAGYRLYTHELYNLQLDSVKLVVLSACEAGNGRLVRGEGVISLARAFAYAGCPNIITTLWKALDKSTAAIASNMHEYLRKGYTKDEALRQAKLDYLEAADVHPLMKTPYHWANFIFIGDPDPIYDAGFTYWWVLAGLMCVVLAYFLFKKILPERQ